MTLAALGLNHKTAPIEVRERVAFAEPDLLPAMTALRALPGIRECLLLSTCNRTEVYLVTPGPLPVAAVTGFLAASRGVAGEALGPSLYLHHGRWAARHAMRVASGLDSMVLGEQQILGQVRRAFDLARAGRTTGPVLNRLMQVAIATGRRVRRETGVSRGTPSVPRAALGLAKSALGALEGRSVLVVGAGEVAGIVVKLFDAAGARIAAVANRTGETARALATRVGAAVIPLEAIAEASREVEVLVVCVGAEAPLVTGAMLAGERDRPLLVIDLGIPRGVEPAAASVPGVTLRVLDQLPVEPAVAEVPPEELARADGIVEEALAGFEGWMASRAAAPMIAALRNRAEAIVERELTRSRGRLQGLDEGQRAAVRAVLDAAVRKLLQAPIVRLRESAARHDARVMEAAAELFELDGDPKGSGAAP